jgi:hypothetical protein
MDHSLDTFADFLRWRDVDEMTVRGDDWTLRHPPGDGSPDPPHDRDDEAMAAGDWEGKVEETELPKVVSLCDTTGSMVQPWLDSGRYECWLVDLENGSGYRRESENLVVYGGDVRTFRMPPNVYMAFAFPPCTDLASSGSRWWKGKDERNAEAGRKPAVWEANDLVIECWDRIRKADRCMLENPVGRLPQAFRPWDIAFHPYEFGGHLPEDDAPEVELPSGRKICFVPRDAYKKKTCVWVGGNFKLPQLAEVPEPKGSYMHQNFGGKSDDTKYARSMTPRGFAIAVFMANDAGVPRRRKPKLYTGPAVAPRKPSVTGRRAREEAGRAYES